MRGRHGVAVAIAVCALLAAAACSSPVTGQGSVVSVTGVPGAPSRFPSAADPPSVPSSASSSAAAPASCAAGAITAAGAPFCYPLPAGLHDFSYLSDYGHGWTFRTLVSIGDHDLIEVLAARGANSDGETYAQLESYYDRQLRLKVGTFHVRKAGAVRRVLVDGARGFEQQVTYVDGVRGDNTYAFRGLSLVDINCQSKVRLRAIRTACGRIRATILIEP